MSWMRSLRRSGCPAIPSMPPRALRPSRAPRSSPRKLFRRSPRRVAAAIFVESPVVAAAAPRRSEGIVPQRTPRWPPPPPRPPPTTTLQRDDAAVRSARMRRWLFSLAGGALRRRVQWGTAPPARVFPLSPPLPFLLPPPPRLAASAAAALPAMCARRPAAHAPPWRTRRHARRSPARSMRGCSSRRFQGPSPPISARPTDSPPPPPAAAALPTRAPLRRL